MKAQPQPHRGQVKEGGRMRGRSDCACVAILVILCCLFFHGVLLNPGKVIFHPNSDFWRFLAPQVTFVVDSFYHDGELPLWEPYAYSGKPPYGVPQLGVFYPFFIFVLLSRSLCVYGYLFAVHFMLAAAGMCVPPASPDVRFHPWHCP